MTLAWPTRAPGRPWLWLLDLATEQAAPRCTIHNVRTDTLGVCDRCVEDWRASLGADPATGARCRVCGLPVHPSQDRNDTCVSCDDTYTIHRREVHAYA